MESLELLKSLTNGINKKSETTLPPFEGKVEEEIIEYTVNTSLRGLKNKKTTIKEEEIVDYMEEESEIIEDYIIEDSETGVELIDLPLDTDITNGTTCELENEHKSEDNIVIKNKIDRQGNPFKRGPRRKKVEEQISMNENIVDNNVSSVELIELSDNPDLSLKEEDFEIEGSEMDSSKLIESDELEEEVLFDETALIAESKTSLNMDEILFDDDCFGDSEDELNESEDFEEPTDIEEPTDFEEPENVEEPEDIEELNDIDDVEDTKDKKFKDCVYYKGMDVEEYLRSNSNYRDALYVEHFYAKEYLNKLLNSGIILYSKGMYRL